MRKLVITVVTAEQETLLHIKIPLPSHLIMLDEPAFKIKAEVVDETETREERMHPLW